MRDRITLIVAYSVLNRESFYDLREKLSSSIYDEAIFAFKGKILSLHRIGNALVLKRNDEGLYNAWNHALRFVKTSHVTFLGLADWHEASDRNDLFTPFDIAFPRGSKGRFFHCGAVFKTNLIRNVKFDESYYALADLDQFLALSSYRKISIGSHQSSVKMAEGGRSYHLSLNLFTDYCRIVRRYPGAIPHVILKVVYLPLRSARMKVMQMLLAIRLRSN